MSVIVIIFGVILIAAIITLYITYSKRISETNSRLGDVETFVADERFAREQPIPVPAKIIPAVKTSLMTFCLNEGKYMEEWVQHHFSLGIDHFYIFDDGSTDNIAQVLQPWVEKGIVTHYKWDLRIKTLGMDIWDSDNPYNVLSKRLSGKKMWLCGLDMDEFIILDYPNKKISDILGQLDDYAGVVLQWRVFGSQGRHLEPEGKVLDSYVYRHSDKSNINNRVKTWVNLSHAHWVTHPPFYNQCSHIPSYEQGNSPFVNTLGIYADGPINEYPVFDRMTVHHYALKSYEYFRRHKNVRYDKSDVPIPERLYGYTFWDERDIFNHDSQVVYDTSAQDPDPKKHTTSMVLDWKKYCEVNKLEPCTLAEALFHAFTKNGPKEGAEFIELDLNKDNIRAYLDYMSFE